MKGIGIMCEVVIGDEEQSHVRIVNFTRTHPDQNDYWDGNWLSCKIQVSSGRFWGEVDACLRSDEFDSFLKQLLPVYQSLGGKAEYHSLEDWMTIELVPFQFNEFYFAGFVCCGT